MLHQISLPPSPTHTQHSGPIVRITPDELHFTDPRLIATVYTGGSKRRDKWLRWIRFIGNAVDQSLVSSAGHDGHRLRRAPLNPFFSKTRVRQLEPVLQRNLAKLLERLAERRQDGTPLDLHMLYGAYTHDLITKYCFGEVHSTDWLDDPQDGFGGFRKQMEGGHGLLPYLSQLYWLFGIMEYIPPSVLARLDEGNLRRVQMQQLYSSLIKTTKAKHGTTKGSKPASVENMVSIVDALLDSDLPPRELEDYRLQIEAEIIVIAGTGTTAWALSVATFHLLNNPLILRRLREALAQAIPDVSAGFTLPQVEQIPYLVGFPFCVWLRYHRLTRAADGRHPRSNPNQHARYDAITARRARRVPRSQRRGQDMGGSCRRKFCHLPLYTAATRS